MSSSLACPNCLGDKCKIVPLLLSYPKSDMGNIACRSFEAEVEW
jgi:hypothetical protein